MPAHLLAALNPPQRRAVEHSQGPLLILAGAGSGKTRVLTHRAAYLIATGVTQAERILCVTFTNKACREMGSRITQLLGPTGRGVWVRTFHSFGLQLIRSGILELPIDSRAVVYDEADQRQLMREAMERLKLDPERISPRTMLGYVEHFKQQGLLPDEVGDRSDLAGGVAVTELYRIYQELLSRNQALDFGDLLLWPLVAIKRNAAVRERVQHMFSHVMVDEFQDTNRIQYDLIKLVVGAHDNLAVVGDDDQAIYAWRGADITNILGFERDYPHATVVRLEQNYRSTRVILDAAWEVVRRNRARKEKRLWTDVGGGDPIRLAVLDDERSEADWVAERVLDETRRGTRLNQIAVFYRTNAQSRSFEEALRLRGIVYRIVGATGFYDRREIKDVLAYLKLIANPRDLVAFQRIVNVPRRGIGKASVERVLAAARELDADVEVAIAAVLAGGMSGKPAAALKSFAELLATMRERRGDLGVSELTVQLLEAIQFREALLDEGAEVGRERLENVRELLAAMQQFEELSEDKSLDRYLDDVSLVAELEAEDNDTPALQLMTLHSAKGLEFDVVFMTGLEENVLPHSRVQDDEGIEEERRLVYVGMTRAKKRLFLTRARTRRTFGARLSQMPSRFLDELPGDAVHDVSPPSRAANLPFAAPPRGAGAYGDAGSGCGGGHGPVVRRGGDAPPRPATTMAAKVPGGNTVPADTPPEYRPGSRLEHPMFGVGIVEAVERGSHGFKLRIQFASGPKTILPAYVELKPR